MTRGFSLYLDALRVFAALVVFASHLAYPRFSEGRLLWIRDFNLGSDAVVVFFVISGFVIAFSAREKDRSIDRFAFARLTRLLSVAVPALILGFAMDRAGSSLDPTLYPARFYNELGWAEQLFRGLTFSNEWATGAVRLGSNGPYWSISYEAAYYALFAVAVYLSGYLRIALLALLCLLFGLNILLLLPCWLVGVWLYRKISSGEAGPDGDALAWAAVLAAPTLYVAAQALAVPETLRLLTAEILGVPGIVALRFSDEFVWNTMLALLTAAHLLGVHRLTSADRVRAEGLPAKTVRFLASCSFSIYLVHYPALQVSQAVLPGLGGSLFMDAVQFAIVLAGCVLFAMAFERTIGAQRAALRALSGQLRIPAVRAPSSKTRP